MMRRDQVLVERSSSGADDTKSSWDGLRKGAWGIALLEALDHASSTPASTSTSPATKRPFKSSRLTARSRPSTRPLEVPRDTTPPLSIHSLHSSLNPFPYFNIRWQLLFEVILLVSALLFALYRLYSISPTELFPNIPNLPYSAITVLTLSVPFIALLRKNDSSFQVPFTDARGYRDPTSADDGVASAIVLPLLLGTSCLWDAYAGVGSSGETQGLEGIRTLVEIWDSQLPLADRLEADLSKTAQVLFFARYQLVLFIFINSLILLLHLILARTFLRIERLPTSNTKRFFGFAALAGSISSLIWIGLQAWESLLGRVFLLNPN